MLVVRAVQSGDLDGLIALASQTGSGMTTLKADRDMLARRVEFACASFAGTIAPECRDYLFVMEDTVGGTLAGVCAIKSAVGLDEPFYNYWIGTLVHASKELGIFSRMDALFPSNDLAGSSELCSLFLHPAYRQGDNGRLLSKSRLLFIAQFPHLFAEKLFAELRGFLRPDGSSPFWDSVGQHFFQMDFERADELTSLGKKSFIAELMPRHPLYVFYLSQEAQQAIGKVHVDTAPARRLLEHEGMVFDGYVDIFDAGPVLQARVRELRALRDSVLSAIDTADAVAANSAATLVTNTALRDFRAIVSATIPSGGRLVLTASEQALLHVGPGDTVRSLSLHATEAAAHA